MRRRHFLPLLALVLGFASVAPRQLFDAPLVPRVVILLPPPPKRAPAPPAEAPPPPPEAPQPYFSQAGLASWYRSSGKSITANGETFRGNAVTAAHRNLPFNTVIRVTNLATGKTAKMRINDRGPFVKGRIIDLSTAAAATIGMAKGRMTRVRIDAFAEDQTQQAALIEAAPAVGVAAARHRAVHTAAAKRHGHALPKTRSLTKKTVIARSRPQKAHHPASKPKPSRRRV